MLDEDTPVAQVQPTGHCGYLGVGPSVMAAALREQEPAGLAGTLLAWEGPWVVGVLAGYIAAQRHEDGSGYLDYLGVTSSWRRHGIGRRLVEAAVDVLVGEYNCAAVHLTVRVAKRPARGLYGGCGFVEERTRQPWRRGFRLGSG